MARFIDADKLEQYTSCIQIPDSLAEVLVIDTEDYDNLPIENVVPVVCCKDCRYCSSYYDSERYCDMFDFEPPSDEFYCRDGERKDDE